MVQVIGNAVCGAGSMGPSAPVGTRRPRADGRARAPRPVWANRRRGGAADTIECAKLTACAVGEEQPTPHECATPSTKHPRLDEYDGWRTVGPSRCR
eukprot:10942363-Heterocapsa_arctica.AAC.1